MIEQRDPRCRYKDAAMRPATEHMLAYGITRSDAGAELGETPASFARRERYPNRGSRMRRLPDGLARERRRSQARLPVIPGHEIVGRVIERGAGVDRFAIGDRVGVPWLAHTCGTCRFCRAGQENLCYAPLFNGFDRDGGFATHAIADAALCLRLPDCYPDVEAAPLLCVGLIGCRSLKRSGPAERIGLYGFGAAAHIIAQVAVHQGRTIFASTRPGDGEGQAFARSLGCAWAGSSDQVSPEPLDAAYVAPVGALVPEST